jgi:hypothetical protein
MPVMAFMRSLLIKIGLQPNATYFSSGEHQFLPLKHAVIQSKARSLRLNLKMQSFKTLIFSASPRLRASAVQLALGFLRAFSVS